MTFKKRMFPPDRRTFLRSIAGGVAVSQTVFTRSAFGQETKNILSGIGKNESLIVHNSRPTVLETPLPLLREHGLTPKEILFVRNNQELPGALTLDPIPADGWNVELSGLVSDPQSVAVEDLSGYEQIERELVLQCSGNGRSFYSGSVRTRGTQWAKGGVGNVRWKGVALITLLAELGIKVHPKAKFLTAEGKDAPQVATAPDFEHSVPLRDVLETALLATEMNGEPIPAIHGGPVRLILPGYFGTMNIKWLSRLRFEAEESSNHHHFRRYRTFRKPITPGSQAGIIPEKTIPTWRQKVKSMIWSPAGGDALKSGPAKVTGVAWNDGEVRLDVVEVSLDQGRSWHRAEVETPSSLFAWNPWTASIELPSGEVEIWARAWDALGRGQPLDGAIQWNPSGYEWYGVDKITVSVS